MNVLKACMAVREWYSFFLLPLLRVETCNMGCEVKGVCDGKFG